MGRVLGVESETVGDDEGHARSVQREIFSGDAASPWRAGQSKGYLAAQCGCPRLRGGRSRAHMTAHLPSPPLSSSSKDSIESLRALEVAEGPRAGGSDPVFSGRRSVRSYSISGFQFEEELLPLTLSESTAEASPTIPKSVGVVKGLFQRYLLSI